MLLLTSASHIIRHECPGRRYRIVDAVQIFTGITFCLLGLLDIGRRTIIFSFAIVDNDVIVTLNHSAPIYTVVIEQWAVAVIAISFSIMLVATLVSGVPIGIHVEETALTSSMIIRIEHRLYSVYYDVAIAEKRLRRFNVDGMHLSQSPRCRACTYKARESSSVLLHSPIRYAKRV